MRISFLIHDAYRVGGTNRAVGNLAGKLADEHDVEIVSVFRVLEEPLFDYDPRVRLRHLVDFRKHSPSYERDHPLHKRPSEMFPAGDRRCHAYSRLTDERIGRHLAELDADVVVGTRPGLNVHIARQAPRSLVRVGQEHLTLDTHSTRLIVTLRHLYPHLDAVTTTTEADADSYRRRMRLPGVRVAAVPNSVPAPDVTPSDTRAPVVVAAGRLAASKRYDDLIRAFALVAHERPEWSLKLYGGGVLHDELAALVDHLGLGRSVSLMGMCSPLEPELAKGSILAVSSTLESFGMTIVEGMRVGLPVVSTDCPLGPGEIIDHGSDGLLVPPRDVGAMAAALLKLIGDHELRARMGRAALVKGRSYDPDRIAQRYAELFQELLDARTRPAGRIGARTRTVAGQAANGVYTAKDALGAGLRKARRLLVK